MADLTCSHCGETHPPETRFCPNTGKPFGPAATPPVPEIPSWVTAPHGPSGAHPVQIGSQDDGGSGPARSGGQPAFGDGTEVGVMDLLKQAFELYQRHAKTLILVAAVVFVPGALLHACASATILAPTVAVTVALDPVTHVPTTPVAVGTVVAGFSAFLLGLIATAVTGFVLYGLIVPLTHGALTLATADRLLGGNADWRQVWGVLAKRLGTVLSAVIPAALLMALGFFCLVIPGLLLAFFFTFVPSVALIEGRGGLAALRRSYELVRSDWLRVLLVLIAFGVLSMVASFIARMLTFGSLFGSQLVHDLLMLVAMPIPVIGAVLLYLDVRRKREGFDQESLRESLDGLGGDADLSDGGDAGIGTPPA